MVSLPALIAALQPFDGRDPTTLNNIGRALRPDFIATSKRGAGAAEMDFRSAANLIFAFYGADAAKDAQAAVATFRDLTGSSISVEEGLPEVFSQLGATNEFGPALELLLQGIPEIVLASWRYILDADFGGDPHKHFQDMIRGRGPVRLTVSLMRYFAEIEFSDTSPLGKSRCVFSKGFYCEIWLQRRAYKQGLCLGTDKKVTTQFGFPTLTAAWGAVTANIGLDDPETYKEALDLGQ